MSVYTNLRIDDNIFRNYHVLRRRLNVECIRSNMMKEQFRDFSARTNASLEYFVTTETCMALVSSKLGIVTRDERLITLRLALA